MSERREALRGSFDDAASTYSEIRPAYPPQLFEDILQLTKIPSSGSILEIGCGTGQATVEFARRGFAIHCVELGSRLADIARENLSHYPGVHITAGAFEEAPIEENFYDLVVAATAFHWIDPKIGYEKASQVLVKHGWIALFWNLHVQSVADRGFFQTVQPIYEREAPELARGYNLPPRPDQVSQSVKSEIEESGLFENVIMRQYLWNEEYSAVNYTKLLSTYSGHRQLSDSKRQRLFEGIRELIDNKFGGTIGKGYLTVLYLARKK